MTDAQEIIRQDDRRRQAPSAFALEQAMSALQAARQRLLEEDPDLAADETLMADILGSDPNTVDAMDVLHRVLRASVHAKSMAAAAEARAAEIELRRDRYRRRAESLVTAAFNAMAALDLRKVELPDLTASLRAGAQSVVILDEDALPDEYVRVATTRTPDKKAIRDALMRRSESADPDQGNDIPGATLSNGLPSLMIKVK